MWSEPATAPGHVRHGTRGHEEVGALALQKLALYLVITWGTMFVLAAGWTLWSIWAVAGALTFTIALITTFFRFRGWPFYPGVWFRLLVVRPFWYLQLMLPLLTIAGLLGLVIGLMFGMAISLGRSFFVVAFCVLAVFFLAGYFGSRRLRVRNVMVSIPSLPQSFDGFRIAQISDLHVGPHLSRSFLSRVVASVEAVDADMIAVTGDLIDDRAEDVAEYERWFGSLRAPSGVYAIAGNHDIYSGWPAVEASLQRIDGLTLLVNDSRLVRRGGDAIAIVGTGDPAATRRAPFLVDPGDAAPDIARTLAGVPAGIVVVALAHNPALWPALAARRVALTLSGHTHWGQLAFPGIPWSAATPFLELDMGTHNDDGSMLYIHPGTGYWGLPFRLGATAEVAVITLRRGESLISVS